MGTTDQPVTAFVAEAPVSPEVQALLDADVKAHGHAMNLTRVWAHHPEVRAGLMQLFDATGAAAGLSVRDRGILIMAGASTLGDSYCALAWGGKITKESGDPEVAACVLRGDDAQLDDRARALAAWARQVASDPNATSSDDVQGLRAVGFDDAQILALTAFVALRLAFSSVNDALGIQPDHVFDGLAEPVRSAVTFGRPVAPPRPT